MEVGPLSHENEKSLDPRVESLAVPLARDYAEKNYSKIGEDEDGNAIFEPAWRGVNGEKELRDKTPEDVAEQLIEEGWSQEAAVAEAQTCVIDIANTPYDQFSEHWKGQNRGGAEFLIALLDKYGADVMSHLDLSDPATINEFGSLIHQNWLERNGWTIDSTIVDSDGVDKVNPVTGKKARYGDPFNQLPEDEQRKDIDQLKVLQGWIQ